MQPRTSSMFNPPTLGAQFYMRVLIFGRRPSAWAGHDTQPNTPASAQASHPAIRLPRAVWPQSMTSVGGKGLAQSWARGAIRQQLGSNECSAWARGSILVYAFHAGPTAEFPLLALGATFPSCMFVGARRWALFDPGPMESASAWGPV